MHGRPVVGPWPAALARRKPKTGTHHSGPHHSSSNQHRSFSNQHRTLSGRHEKVALFTGGPRGPPVNNAALLQKAFEKLKAFEITFTIRFRIMIPAHGPQTKFPRIMANLLSGTAGAAGGLLVLPG